MDPLASIILFFSVTIFSFINNRELLFIFIDILLIILILRGSDLKRVKNLSIIYLFAIIHIIFVGISFVNGFAFDMERFRTLFFRVSTLIFTLFFLSNKASYKGIINALHILRFPATLLELTAISFLGIQLSSRSANRLLVAMKSRNLFSTALGGIYSTGVFLGAFFRTILQDTKVLSMVSSSRRVDNFYTIMIEDTRIKKDQLFFSIITGSCLILLGILSRF